MATLTVYPDPDPETSTVDGQVQASNVDFSVARSASSGTPSATAASASASVTISLGQYVISRLFVLFDTSALTSAANISAATLSMFPISLGSDGEQYVVSSNPASNTTLKGTDYATVGSTSFGTGTVVSTGSYFGFTLNASGIAAISKTGITKLAVLSYRDFANTAPSDNNSRVQYSTADYTGTTQDPKLEITYAFGPAGVASFDGVAVASISTLNEAAWDSISAVN